MSCPSPGSPRRVRCTALIAAALSLALFAPTSAEAAPGAARPIAGDDAYEIYASGEYTLDVLANDDTTSPGSGELTLCGVTVDDTTQRVLYAEIDRTDPSRVYVEANRNADGVARFTYDVCQGDQRDTSTVTVDISLLLSPKVVKRKNRRGQLRAGNPNDVRLTILWGSNRANITDGQRGIDPGRTISIGVTRSRIYWVAYLIDQGSVVVAGEGTVRNIRLR